jgi:hypothetical protein
MQRLSRAMLAVLFVLSPIAAAQDDPPINEPEGFILHLQPRAINLGAFAEILGRWAPGTNQYTTPAIIYGEPDWAWSKSANIATMVGPGKMRMRWIEGEEAPTLPEEMLTDPQNYVYDDEGNPVGVDFDAVFDSIAHGIVEVELERDPEVSAGPSAEGIASKRDVVWFQIRSDMWVVASRLGIVMTFATVDENDEPQQVSTRWYSVTPIFYAPSAQSAEMHARYVWGSGDLAAASGAGGAEPSLKSISDYTGGQLYMSEYSGRIRTARTRFLSGVAGCDSEWSSSMGNTVVPVALAGCVAGAGACASTVLLAPVAPLCCGLVGGMLGGMVLGFEDDAYSSCIVGKSLDQLADVQVAVTKLIRCCTENDGCSPLPYE